MSSWKYLGKDLTVEDLEGYKSFVYKITYLPTGKAYIGKKTTISTSRKKVKGRTNRKVVRKPSNWMSYWGSNQNLLDDIKAHGHENFSRDVLKLCKTKGDASYAEAFFQFTEGVLLYPDKYYNQHFMVHVHGKHLTKGETL